MMQDPTVDGFDGDEDESSDAAPAEPTTFRDLLLSGVSGGGPAPIILDPKDGLPRPKDEGFTPNGVPAATDENLVCLEGGTWLAQDEEGSWNEATPPDEARLQLHSFGPSSEDVPRRVFLDPETQTLWRRSRPACVSYVEMETLVSDLELEGHVTEPRTLLRKCQALNMVLTDEVVRACTSRHPRDVVSEQRLVDRARAKAALAKLGGTPLFREATPEEQGPVFRAEDATSLGFVDSFRDAGTLLGYLPVDPPTLVVRSSPLYVFFPDEAWQPPPETYHSLKYTDDEGKSRVWSASLSGELILRQSPGFDDGDLGDAKPLARIRELQWDGHIRAITEALVSGRDVAVVAYHACTERELRRRVQATMAERERPLSLVVEHPTTSKDIVILRALHAAKPKKAASPKPKKATRPKAASPKPKKTRR